MFEKSMTLPTYHMTAGETKHITIPIYNPTGRQIDATGMTARLAIYDCVNYNAEPIVIKNCSVVPGKKDMIASLFVVLDSEDTILISGKFVYQVTGKDFSGNIGVMRGLLIISPNGDVGAISSL